MAVSVGGKVLAVLQAVCGARWRAARSQCSVPAHPGPIAKGWRELGRGEESPGG